MDFPGVHHAPFHSVIQEPRLTEVQLFSTRASKAALGIDIQQTRGGGQHRGGTLLPPVHLDSTATPSNLGAQALINSIQWKGKHLFSLIISHFYYQIIDNPDLKCICSVVLPNW